MATVNPSPSNWPRFYGVRRGLAGLDLDVREGEVYGFLGPNGAGKTTTIRILLDLIRPTSGVATLFGQGTARAAPPSAGGSATCPATSSSPVASPRASC